MYLPILMTTRVRLCPTIPHEATFSQANQNYDYHKHVLGLYKSVVGMEQHWCFFIV